MTELTLAPTALVASMNLLNSLKESESTLVQCKSAAVDLALEPRIEATLETIKGSALSLDMAISTTVSGTVDELIQMYLGGRVSPAEFVAEMQLPKLVNRVATAPMSPKSRSKPLARTKNE